MMGGYTPIVTVCMILASFSHFTSKALVGFLFFLVAIFSRDNYLHNTPKGGPVVKRTQRGPAGVSSTVIRVEGTPISVRFCEGEQT